MLQQFRKPKWRHAKPAVRRQAVEQLSPDNSDEVGILQSLAREDADAGVRRAAIRKISSLAFLRQRMEEETDSGVGEAAAVRYRQILAGGSGTDDLRDRIEELAFCPNARVLAHVVRGGREEGLRLAALERCRDESILADAAVNDPVARVRQAAVERLTDAAALQRVAERTRHGDRKISRLARDRLRAGEAEAEARAARARERAAVLDALGRVAQAADRPHAAELKRLENRWRAAAEDAGTADSERFDALLADCRRRIDDDRPDPAAQTVPAASGPAVETLWRELRDAPEPDAERVDALNSALENAGETGDDGTYEAARDYLAAARRYLGLRARLEETLGELRAAEDAERIRSLAASLEALCGRLQWPGTATTPRTLQESLEAIHAARTPPRAAADPNSRQSFGKLNEQLRAVDAGLQQGNLREAQRALRKAKELVEALPSGIASSSERALRRYTARVAELRDWRRFATLPKQEQICEQMEALIGSELAPPELAAAIKSLRDEWKETGGSDSAESRRLWERFQAASERAFEPCRAYFDEQARRRQENLAERERIAGQLESFMVDADWDALETGKLVEIRAKAREEWNRFSPVERGAAKPVSRRFESLMDRLTERIRDRQEHNRQQKAALLEQARALGEPGPLERRLEEAKALQARWRELGPAQPAQERKLFRAFKSACDAVFAEREQDRKAEQQQRERRKGDAEQLCERLEALSAGDSDDPEAIQRELDSAETAFRGLGPLPRGVSEGIERRFARAATEVRRRLARQAEMETERSYERLRWRAELCRRLEAAAESGGETGLDRLQAEWDAMEATPADLTEPLERRWARARDAARDGGFPAAERDAAVSRARRLCVAMEILGGVESPEDDSELRMRIQVERLSEGLASSDNGRQDPARAARSLELEWLSNGPLPEDTRRQLESRFRRARDAALQEASAA